LSFRPSQVFNIRV